MSLAIGLHNRYIRGTERKALVQLVQIFLCHITASVAKGIGCECTKTYLGTRVLKHVYDKRPAQEYDLLTCNLEKIVKYPERVYRNKNGKKGCYCFVRKIGGEICLCSIEVIDGSEDGAHCEIVTFFTTDERYLTRCELLWEWKDGDPSS